MTTRLHWLRAATVGRAVRATKAATQQRPAAKHLAAKPTRLAGLGSTAAARAVVRRGRAVIEQLEAISDLAAIPADCWSDNAEGFTCHEAQTLASALRAAGNHGAAATLLDAHAAVCTVANHDTTRAGDDPTAPSTTPAATCPFGIEDDEDEDTYEYEEAVR